MFVAVGDNEREERVNSVLTVRNFGLNFAITHCVLKVSNVFVPQNYLLLLLLSRNNF